VHCTISHLTANQKKKNRFPNLLFTGLRISYEELAGEAVTAGGGKILTSLYEKERNQHRILHVGIIIADSVIFIFSFTYVLFSSHSISLI